MGRKEENTMNEEMQNYANDPDILEKFGRNINAAVRAGKVDPVIGRDEEIRKIIDTNYARALEVLRTHESVLHDMVRLLFVHETIYGDEIDLLMEGKSVDDVNEYIRNKKEEQLRLTREKEEAARPQPVLGNASSIIVPEPKASGDAPSDNAPEAPALPAPASDPSESQPSDNEASPEAAKGDPDDKPQA